MANWRVVSKSGPSFEGGVAPAPTNPNNLAAVLDGYTTDKSKVRVKVTFDALTSPTKGLHVHYEDPDHSAATPLSTDGTTPADGTHPTLGTWKTYDAGRYTTSPVILEFTAKPARNVRIYGNPYTALNEPALVQAGLTGATPSIVVTIPEVPSGPVGNEYCNDVTGVAFSNHLVYLEGGVYKESLDVTFTPPKDPRWTGVWVQTWIQDPTAGTWKLWAEQGLRKPGTLTYTPTWERLFNAQIRFVSFNDPRTSKPEDDNRNTYIPGFTPTLTLTVGKSDGKTLDLTAAVDGTLDIAAFAASHRAVALFASNPALPNTKYPAGSYGTNTTTGAFLKVNSAGNAWIKAVNGSTDLVANSVTTPCLAAGAVTTTALATTDILCGQGGGKPGRFKAVDSIGTMLAFIGYDSASGFGGVAAINGRFGGSDPINSPVINCSASGVALNGATISLNLNGVTTTIANTYDTYGYAGLTVKLAATPNQRVVISHNDIIVFNASGAVTARVLGSGAMTGLSLSIEGTWSNPLKLGNARLWVDNDRYLRIKNGAPTYATDGGIVMRAPNPGEY